MVNQPFLKPAKEEGLNYFRSNPKVSLKQGKANEIFLNITINLTVLLENNFFGKMLVFTCLFFHIMHTLEN